VIAEELQAAGGMKGGEQFQKQPPKQSREHADGEEEAGPAGDPSLPIARYAATWHDDVDMRVISKRRDPAVQYGGEADPGTKVLRIEALAARPWHLGQCRLRQELSAISVCEHFSRRATWPPRAAVRELSMAD
jgi:hypothetical protein